MKPPRNPLAGTRNGAAAGKPRRGLFIPKLRGRRKPGSTRRAAADPVLDERLGELGIPSAQADATNELYGYMAAGRRTP